MDCSGPKKQSRVLLIQALQRRQTSKLDGLVFSRREPPGSADTGPTVHRLAMSCALKHREGLQDAIDALHG